MRFYNQKHTWYEAWPPLEDLALDAPSAFVSLFLGAIVDDVMLCLGKVEWVNGYPKMRWMNLFSREWKRGTKSQRRVGY